MIPEISNQKSRIKPFNNPRLMTTKSIAGQRHACPEIAMTFALDAQACCPFAVSRASFLWRGISDLLESSKADCNGDNACLEAPIARRPSQRNVGI